jgi:hypothetical protein
MKTLSGCLDKMVIAPDAPAYYTLTLGESHIAMNPLLGQHIRLQHTGRIFCTHCQRKTNKSFGQGYCFPCFRTLAQCDTCIMSPEKCHWHLGTCREPEWAQTHCHLDHIVYLANTSGLKVGITRASQMPTRWLDQGAIQALPVARVSNRLQSGLVEVLFKQFIADKTDWRALLRQHAEPIDLPAARDRLFDQIRTGLETLQHQYGLTALQWLPDAVVHNFEYPVEQHPLKTTTLNLDKTPVVEGVLTGIKGQYLFFPHGAVNVRKFTAYEIELSH